MRSDDPPSAAPDQHSLIATLTAMIENEATEDPSEVEVPTANTPDVDELEDRLRDLQSAMDQIQSGDLDAAERGIEALEGQMKSTRDRT